MIGNDFSSSIKVGYSPFPTEFHCHLCNVSFTKRKFLKMHCDGLFHRDKVILSQTSTTGHPLPANQNSELLFMPTQSNNRILYFETDYSGRRSDDQSTAFSRDGNLEKRNDVQAWTKPQEDNSSMVSTSSKGCRRSISPDFSTGSESFYGHEVQRNVFPGFVFDHMHSSDFVPTQIGKQSHDEEFHEVDHLPFNETVSYSCRADSASNVVIEFDCKVCQRFTPDGSSQNEHFSSLEHCKLVLLRQHELGLAKFHQVYGNVPFLRILSASVPVPPPEFDANLTRIYRSAVVNELRCRACGTEHEDLKSWFGHSFSENHSKKLYELLHQSDVYMFLSMFGDLPLPESMLPLLNESGRAMESNYLQMPKERSPLNQLKKNLKPLENLKVIDHNFASVETPVKKRLHSTECDEIADDSKRATVSPAKRNNIFGNIVKVVDHNFESVPEVIGPHEQNLPSSSPSHLLESLSENLRLLKVASLSSHSDSLLQPSNTEHMSHESELQLSSEGKSSKPDQKTERLHVESSGAEDLPVVSEVESPEQMNQTVEDFDRLSGSCTQNDEAINVSQCTASESGCQKGFGEISRISVHISNPGKCITSLNENVMMEEGDLTSITDVAPFHVDLAGVDDAVGRIPVLTSFYRMTPEPRSYGGCNFEHLVSVAPQPNFSQLEVTSNCEEIGVMVSCGENDQSENQITRSFDEVTEAAFGLDGWSSSCGCLAFSVTPSSIFQPASQTTAGDLLSLVDTPSHPNYVDSRSKMSISELCVAIPVVSSSKEIFSSDVTNSLQQPFLSDAVMASGVTEINNGNVGFSSSSARLVSRNSILVASQSPVDKEQGLHQAYISFPSHVTDASAINCQTTSIHGLERAKTNHGPVYFTTTECTSIDIPALTMVRSACDSQAAYIRTEDGFGTVTISVCASVCSSILPTAPKFPSPVCTLTMPTDVAESMHSAAPHRPVARNVDVNCCTDTASSASATVADLFLLASAANALNTKPLEIPMTTTRTAESDAHDKSQHKVICPSNSSLHVTVPTSNGQSVESSDSASNSFHASSNSLHPIQNATSLTLASKQDLDSAGRNADANISLACHLNTFISSALLLTDSATFRHPSATMFKSFGPASDISKLSSSPPMMTKYSSAVKKGDEMLESMAYLGYSVATMPSKSSAFIGTLSNVSSMAKLQGKYVSEGIHVKLEPISDAADKKIPTFEYLPSVKSNKSEGIIFSKSTITTDVLSLSAAVSTAKTNISECTNSLFSTATKDNFTEKTSFNSSEKTVEVKDPVSHHASVVTITTPTHSLGSTYSMASTDMKTTLVINRIANTISSHTPSTSHARSTSQFATTIAKDDSISSFPSTSTTEMKVHALESSLMNNKCLVKNTLLRPAADVVASTLQSVPHVITTTVKCEKNPCEPKSVSLPSATTTVADGVKHTIISTSTTDTQPKCISVKLEPSVTTDVAEGTSQPTALSTVVIITAPASSVIDNLAVDTVTQSRHGVPADVLKSISQTTPCLATTVLQSTGAEDSGRVTVRLAKRKLSRFSPSIAVIKDISTKSSTSLPVTEVKNTMRITSVKIKPKLSVKKDNAAVLATTKAISSMAETKTNNTALTTSSKKSDLASVSKTRVSSVSVTTIKCNSLATVVTTRTIVSKPVITQSRWSRNSPKTLTTSNRAPLLAVAKVAEATARITSAKAGDVPLVSAKTSLSNSNPCVGSVTVTTNKSQPLISTAAVAKVATVGSSKSETNAAALKSSKVVARKTSVTSVLNCCSVATVTTGSKISTVSASKTTCSLTTSKPTSVSTSAGSASRAANSAPITSNVACHTTTTTDSGVLVNPTIRTEVVIKTEPEVSKIGKPVLLGNVGTASNSQTKEPLVSAAEPADLKKADTPAISEAPPVTSRSTANPKQSLVRTSDRNPSCSAALTSPKKREWKSSFCPRNQQRFNSQINCGQARWRTELEAKGNRFAAPLFGQDVHDNDWGRRSWSDSVTQKYSSPSSRRNCSPPPKRRRLTPEDGDVCNRDNFNNQHYRFIPERKLQQFADCLKDVAVVLQRNSRRFSFSENIIFMESLPWLERQKLALLSKFTGVQDSRLLLSASQLLARLDLGLLERIADLQMLCLESSVDVCEMMLQLLEALDEGCHQNLF